MLFLFFLMNLNKIFISVFKYSEPSTIYCLLIDIILISDYLNPRYYLFFYDKLWVLMKKWSYQRLLHKMSINFKNNPETKLSRVFTLVRVAKGADFGFFSKKGQFRLI